MMCFGFYWNICFPQYEPVFGSDKSKEYLQSMVLYECQGSSSLLQALARDQGQFCADRSSSAVPCNAIVASWTRGSEVNIFINISYFLYHRYLNNSYSTSVSYVVFQGFTFPPEAGYPLDTDQRFYLMETHYNNPSIALDWDTLQSTRVYDNSGLRLYYTPVLRMHDAGVLSIGMYNIPLC